MSKLKISLIAVVIVVVVFVTFRVMVASGAAFSINAEYVGAAGGCTDQNPILVTITNRLPFNMNHYWFSLSATREGYSSNVRNDLSSRDSDKIIPAFESDRRCWATPQESLAEAYLPDNINKYGSSAAAQIGLLLERKKEDPSLNWAAKIESAYWDFGLRY